MPALLDMMSSGAHVGGATLSIVTQTLVSLLSASIEPATTATA